ncbi:MAG: hypothetical protein Q8P22_02425, partial [Chloroflexota bacterium]|nr:hypothetical protein [Chloroflexota bacterium]
MSSQAEWSQGGSRKNWPHRFVTFAALMAVAALVAIGYRFFVSESFGKPYAASLARLASESEGIRGLGIALVR